MSTLIISMQARAIARNERGNATADYLATALVAVALVMAVFAIVTTNGIHGVLQTLIEKALTTATNLIKQ